MALQIKIVGIECGLVALLGAVVNETVVTREACLLVKNDGRAVHVPKLTEELLEFVVAHSPRHVVHIESVDVSCATSTGHYQTIRVISNKWMLWSPIRS